MTDADGLEGFHPSPSEQILKNPGWLFDIGDYTTQLYGDYFISQYKDPY